MASWKLSKGEMSGASSTAGSGSGSGGDGASASAASCSTATALGPQAALELLPCATLVFSTQGQLIGVNSKAAELHAGGAWGCITSNGAFWHLGLHACAAMLHPLETCQQAAKRAGP